MDLTKDTPSQWRGMSEAEKEKALFNRGAFLVCIVVVCSGFCWIIWGCLKSDELKRCFHIKL
jgi:hypothetical protein